MQTPPPQILIITGLMAAGKSTIAQALAERLPRSVHLRGDVFRKMVVNGRADMSPEPSEDARSLLRLRYALACEACSAYAEAGFFVAYQDVILGEHLKAVTERLSGWSPGVVVLNPKLDVIAGRDAARHKRAYGAGWTPDLLAAGLDHTPRLGLWLDTSSMIPSETVDFILAHPSETRRGLSGAAARQRGH